MVFNPPMAFDPKAASPDLIANDYVIDQGWADYTPADHALWRTLFQRQEKILPNRVVDAFLDNLARLDIAAHGIPDFNRLSEVLYATTGWQVVAVPGLVPDEVFYRHLAARRFPAGNFIRRPDQLDYIEEPDVFHDVFGHVPMLMHPVFADYVQAYAAQALATDPADLHRLERLYWYTVEFGLIEADAGVRIYGAGIASSGSESVFSLESPSPNRVAFDVARVMRSEYRIDDFQPTYFVIKNADQLYDLVRGDVETVFAQVRSQPDIPPGELIASDTVLHSGTGAYHAG